MNGLFTPTYACASAHLPGDHWHPGGRLLDSLHGTVCLPGDVIQKLHRITVGGTGILDDLQIITSSSSPNCVTSACQSSSDATRCHFSCLQIAQPQFFQHIAMLEALLHLSALTWSRLVESITLHMLRPYGSQHFQKHNICRRIATGVALSLTLAWNPVSSACCTPFEATIMNPDITVPSARMLCRVPCAHDAAAAIGFLTMNASSLAGIRVTSASALVTQRDAKTI